jgi:hypothetical protein
VGDGAFSPRDAHHHDADGNHDHAFDHEAILGSTKEAAEFDNLSPDEAKQRLKVLVGKINVRKTIFGRTLQAMYGTRVFKNWILQNSVLSENF